MDDFKGTTQQDLCQTIHRGKILLFQVVGLMDQSVSKGRNGFYPHFVKYLTNDIKTQNFSHLSYALLPKLLSLFRG